MYNAASPKSASPPQVPVTALRRLYDLLRITSSKFHLATAKELNRKPSVLINMVKRSSNHFSAYENREANFHGRGNSGSLTKKCESSTRETNRLVVALKKGPSNFNAPAIFALDYVDYEVCSNRTADGARFEDGRKAKRGSSVDLLLCCRGRGLPIICEMKMAARGKRDQNTFFALIQGLMYAVEFLTESQRRRLRNVYGEKFSYPETGPYADLYLILIGHDPAGLVAELHGEAKTLAKKLMETDNSISSLLRQIVCLNARLEVRNGNDYFSLEELFAYPPVCREESCTDDVL